MESKERISMLKEFRVPSMSCQHCVNAITSEVQSVDGVQNVKIDLNTKRVSVQTDERVPAEAVLEAIKEAGYDDVTALS
jgi:copper ion binding protein